MISIQRNGPSLRSEAEEGVGNGNGNGDVGDVESSIRLPAVDAVVLARVTRINPRQANVVILVIGDVVCRHGFPGVIRWVLSYLSFIHAHLDDLLVVVGFWLWGFSIDVGRFELMSI